MTYLIIALIILIILSAYFSATETAFSTFNKIKMKNAAAAGDKRAEIVLELASDYDRLLSTILIGNNIVNIVSTTLATIIFTGVFGKTKGPTFSTIAMTIIVLIFGEISPKSIAKDMPESFAIATAPFLKIIFVLLKPFNYFFTLWKKFLSKIIKIRNPDIITEEEILTIVEEATHDGTLNKHESDLIRNAIEFDDLEVSEICTPRTRIIAVKESAAMEDVTDCFNRSGYSRLPVYKKSIDNIIGFINQKDYYRYVVEEGKEMADIIAPIPLVPPNTNISKLMRNMQQKHSQIALIVDEYGGTFGIVTLEDILEELVGEIWDEHDNEIPDMIRSGIDEYTVLGTANLSDIFEYFNKECDSDYVSINGWLSEKLEKIPSVGDSISTDSLKFTVTKANSRRALEVKIEKICTPAENQNI
ncbi:hypothetical protein IMSAG049_00202 [Clostridiales bacterium]|nr:hypothetical protein IMSAG049_00202 [Clostridiales bacterium]